MANSVDRKMQVVLRTLEKLDNQLENMITDIMMQKNENDMNSLGGVSDQKTIDADIVTNYMRTINSVIIDDNANVLVKINEKYNNAISTLKQAIATEDPNYKKQFEAELVRLQENKAMNYDSIAETYREISERLERGDAQKDYYQDKVDEKEAELRVKEKHYSEKNGNLKDLPIILQEEYGKIEEAVKFQNLYKELVELNKEVEKLENEIKNGSLTDEEKEEKNAQLETLKKQREEKVKYFEQIARDKDGHKYVKVAGKSDKDYINELDAIKIKEAIDYACNDFKAKILSIPEEDRKFTLLDMNMNENGIIDIASYPIGDEKAAESMMNSLKAQKSLWDKKQKEEGYDKQKIEKERRTYQEKIDNYDRDPDVENRVQTLPALSDEGTTYKERYAFNRKNHGRISSFFKSIFRKGKTEEEMFGDPEQRQEQRVYSYNDGIDIEKSKKEALRYLTKNTKKLNNLSLSDKNSKDESKKKEFHNKLNYNVTVTEEELRRFWNKNENQAKDDNQR